MSAARELLLARLSELDCRPRPSGGSWSARCPAHDDRAPSLSIGDAEQFAGAVLTCHAGCDLDAILGALQLGRRDLFDEPKAKAAGYTVAAEYPYRDEAGTLLYVVERRFPKDFRQRRPDGAGGWAWKLDGVRRVLYRLPQTLEALTRGDTIFVVEGEADVAALVRAGVAATCNPGGAGKWRPEYGDTLRGAHVIVVADRDAPGRAHAAAAAADLAGKAASVRVVEPAEGKDAADHLAAGRTVDELTEATGSTDDHSGSSETSWPYEQPIPLLPPRTPAPFPVDALPAWAADYVETLAEFTQTPADLPGMCVLGVLATCAGGRAVVQARPGWREPTNLYLLPVMPPGTRKSAVITTATTPLYEVERDLQERGRAAASEAAITRDILAKAAEKARQDASRAPTENRDQLIAEAISAATAAESVDVPPLPRLIADDVTPEAAASLIAAHGGRLAIVSAEGGIFDVLAGRYSGGIPQLDVWLKAHAGDPLRVDRKGRDSEYIKAPALSMLLTVQPQVLTTIARNGAFRGRGLLARVLYSVPANNVGHRRIGTASVPEAVAGTYAANVRALAERLIDWHDPAVLVLSPDAASLLLDTEQNIEPQLAADGALGGIAEWGSKLVGATLRIAGLLHLATGPDALRHPIEPGTLADAVRIGTYLTEHARAAFQLLGEDTDTAAASYILDHLRRNDAEEFTVRSLFTALPRGRFAKADQLTAALDVLEAHGWVARMPAPKHEGPGRKPSPTYTVHPETHAAQSAQSAEPHTASHSADNADSAETSPKESAA